MESSEGKVALVTGGSCGIGLAITKTLLAEGMRVAICGRDEEKLRKVAKGLKAFGESLMISSRRPGSAGGDDSA